MRVRLLLGVAACSLSAARAPAATVTLITDQASLTSNSWLTAADWSNTAAPSAGNDYVVGSSFTLRTQNIGTADTFGGASLTIQSGAALYLKGSAAHTITINDLRLNGGQVSHAGGAAAIFTLAGNITLGSSTVSTLNSSSSGRTINTTAALSGSGNLLVTGSGGVVNLAAANTSFTGDTQVTSGNLVVAHQNALVSSTLDLGSLSTGGVTFSQNSTLGGLTGSGNLNLGGYAISIGNHNADTTYGGVLSNGSLIKVGTGTLTLSNANSYAGNTTIGNNTANVGAVNVTASGALGSGTVSIVSNSGSGNYAQLRLNSATGITLANNFSTSGTGPGGDNLIDNQSGNNVISGTMTLIGGGGSTAIKVSGGSLTLSGGITTNTTGRVLMLGGTASGTVSGAIADGSVTNTLALSKSGTGTWALGNANTYSGTTTINGGTLAVNGTGSINNTSSITVNPGGALRYNSSTALTRAPTLNGVDVNNRATLGGGGNFGTLAITLDNIGDVLSPGNSPGVQAFGAGQTWTSFTYEWELNDWGAAVAGTHIDQIQITGGLTLNGSAYGLDLLSLIDINNLSGAVANFSETNNSWTILTTTTGITGFDSAEWTINAAGFLNSEGGTWSLAQSGNNLVLSYAAIPEPGVAVLGGLSLLGLLLRRRR